MDALSDILRVLRVSGCLVLNDTYAAPWSVAVPESARLAELAGIAPTDQVAAFHLVQRGSLELTSTGGDRTRASEGDLLIGFGGEPHELSLGDGARSIPLEHLIGSAPSSAQANVTTTATTTLLCGVFGLGPGRNSLITALPPIVHVRAGSDDQLDALATLLAREVTGNRPGSTYAVSRILELLCAAALREIATDGTAEQPGWLRSLDDPAVFAALSAVHRDPGNQWTVRLLAGEAALSPSRLTARFREALGESPMSYVARWRMVIAGQLLAHTDLPIQRVAAQVGYTNQPSFSRAFHRAHGCAPRDYRAHSTTGP